MNVIPQVTAKPTYGGASIGTAQLDLGGVMPSVRLPSRIAGSNGTSLSTAALYSRTVRDEAVGVDASSLPRQLLDASRPRPW